MILSINIQINQVFLILKMDYRSNMVYSLILHIRFGSSHILNAIGYIFQHKRVSFNMFILGILLYIATPCKKENCDTKQTVFSLMK